MKVTIILNLIDLFFKANHAIKKKKIKTSFSKQTMLLKTNWLDLIKFIQVQKLKYIFLNM